MMTINHFRGDVTEILARNEPLTGTHVTRRRQEGHNLVVSTCQPPISRDITCYSDVRYQYSSDCDFHEIEARAPMFHGESALELFLFQSIHQLFYPQIIYFYYCKWYLLDQSIPKALKFILKTKSLDVGDTLRTTALRQTAISLR